MFSGLERLEALQSASGPFKQPVIGTQTVMRQHLPEDEGKTRCECINGKRLALEISVGRNVRLNHQPQERGIAPHERKKIRCHIDLCFALPLLIGHDVVKTGESNLPTPRDHSRELLYGIDRIMGLYVETVRFEKSPLDSGPQGQIKATRKNNDIDRTGHHVFSDAVSLNSLAS